MTSTRTIGRDSATLRVQGWDGSSLVAGPLGGADPLGFAAGDANLYRYVGNDPVDMVDPSGLQEKSLPDKSTVVDISTGVIDKLKKDRESRGRKVKTSPYNGPCAVYAQDMTDALNSQKIAYTLHYYKVSYGSTFVYTYPNKNKTQIDVRLNAREHVIVEVKCMSGGKEETIYFDSGIGLPGSLSNGNVGDTTTGIIAPENKNPKIKNTETPILTPYDPPK